MYLICKTLGLINYNIKMYTNRMWKQMVDVKSPSNQRIGVFVVVFLIGVAFSLFLQFLPEILRLIPTNISMGKANVLEKYSRSKIFGAGLPWKQHLLVSDESVFEPNHLINEEFNTRKSREDLEKTAEKSSRRTEALASLRLALDMRSDGKEEKALKLFRQAFALDSSHPDVLNHYGEFLEEHTRDVILAEHLYSRVLRLSPDHSKAIINRQRTLPIVEELDEEYLVMIDAKRDQLLTLSPSDPSLRRISKEAYFQHIYHTVGLEGNTMSLSETRQIVETHLAIGGKSIVEHSEILGLEAALGYINTTLLHKFGALTLDDILEIHKRVMGFVDPLGAGHLRNTRVFVGKHIPPLPNDLAPLLNDFICWINSDEALMLHPVRLAALVHYKFVHIHPFVDGNGRTSRLLMNLVLMRAGYPPVIIRKQDRLQYYQHLETANEGDVRPFIRFIAQCTEKTLDVYLYATQQDLVPALENQGQAQKIILNV